MHQELYTILNEIKDIQEKKRLENHLQRKKLNDKINKVECLLDKYKSEVFIILANMIKDFVAARKTPPTTKITTYDILYKLCNISENEFSDIGEDIFDIALKNKILYNNNSPPPNSDWINEIRAIFGSIFHSIEWNDTQRALIITKLPW